MRPPREASHGREIFKVELFSEIEGSLYGACVSLFLKAWFVTDHDTIGHLYLNLRLHNLQTKLLVRGDLLSQTLLVKTHS